MMYRILAVLLCVSAISPVALFAAKPQDGGAKQVDFAHQILPVLRKHCGGCHAGDQKKGGLSMNTRAALLEGSESGEVVEPGDAEHSRLIEVIASTDDGEWMPPEGPRVPAEDVALLRRWIDQKLPWDEGVTLGKTAWQPKLKPRTVTLPPAQNGRMHPIDRLLDADLKRRGKQPPAMVSDAVFLRRATLDANGLLPTPAELDAFAAGNRTGKREKLIADLLSRDVAYADHWLTMWNDLLRNDFTGTGFITGGRKQITGWLYEALRTNKPYDQFVRELISPQPEAAGFINGIQWRGNVNASQTREIQFSQNISQVFLGINMKCASCHDSFIDRWKLSEAYGLAAIFADKPLELYRCDKPTGKMASPRWIFPELGDIDAKAPKAERLKQLAGLMTHPQNGRFTRTVVNRIWERLMGRGIVHPVDAMHTRPWNEDLLDFLAVQFAKDGYDLKRFIQFVMTSQAYQSQAAILQSAPGEDYQYAGPVSKRMTAEQFMDTVWQITGANPAKAEASLNRFVTETPPAAKPAAEQLKVADVSASWIWHSGPTGKKSQLKRTFTLTAPPAAARLMATCDNAFTMHINGVKVAASKVWTEPVYADITPHLRKGENTITVAAEMFGGSAGFIAQIDYLEGGSQKRITTDKQWQARPGDNATWQSAAVLKPHGAAPWNSVLKPAAATQPQNRKTHPVRAALVKNDFLMRSLGRPNRDQVVTTRPNELSTLQAIDLSNGEILAGYLRSGARKLTSDGKGGRELAAWVFRFALSREPSAEELAVLVEVAGNGKDAVAAEDLLWMVFMQPEFQMIR